MLDQILSQAKPMILSKLSGATGLTGGAADSFIAKVGGLLTGVLSSGKFDIASLLSGAGGAAAGVQGLVNQLNLGDLAGMVGGSTQKAQAGATAVVGGLMDHLKANPASAESLISQIAGQGGGGLLGKLGGMASGIFGKKP
jgi:hypothetical protein